MVREQTHHITPLTLGETNLETLKVARLLPLLPGGELLGPRRRLPLVSDLALLECALDGAGTGRSRQRRDRVRGQDQVTVRESLTRNARRWAIDQCPVVVNDLGNDGELASRRTVVDEDNAADLDEALEGGRSLNLQRGRSKG